MEKFLDQHFNQRNLDIRRKAPGFSRFMDQKVTPDVLSFIADCILNLPDHKPFTVRDIWKSNYFEKNTKAIFGKPAPSNETAFSEYNKFIGQPLKTLAYAQVLNETKDKNTNRYSIGNREFLEYISLNERSSLNFLQKYLVKVLTDSGFYAHFETYRDQVRQNKDSMCFYTLKQRFHRFMLGNTEINGIIEINRILPKVINPLAVKENIPGSEKGHVTKHPFTFSDLMYNRVNFRDFSKAKGVSRREASEVLSRKQQQRDFAEYRTAKAVDIIKRKYASSEVKDQWANGQATQVHHIFPRAKYSEFIAYTENLIKLTPEQHLSQAHPNARTQEVNRDYQIQCLLAKCESIERSLRTGEFFYSRENMIYMINACLGLNLEAQASFNDIRKILIDLQTRA